MATDQRLCAGLAIGLALIVLVGFAQTYYLKVLFGTPPLRLPLHVHGIVMTAWVALFVFLPIPLGILLLFATFATAAILLRRRAAYHKRFMALACLSIVLPGLDRLPLQLIENADRWILLSGR